jgi:hypothetical protein
LEQHDVGAYVDDCYGDRYEAEGDHDAHDSAVHDQHDYQGEDGHVEHDVQDADDDDHHDEVHPSWCAPRRVLLAEGSVRTHQCGDADGVQAVGHGQPEPLASGLVRRRAALPWLT